MWLHTVHQRSSKLQFINFKKNDNISFKAILLHLLVFSPFFLCFCLSQLQSAHWPISLSEHRVVIIQSQSVHCTAAQTHLNSAHNHYYISIFLSLSKSPPTAWLTWPPNPSPMTVFFGSVSHLCIQCTSPSPSDKYTLTLFIWHPVLRAQDGRKLWFTYLWRGVYNLSEL